jgi:1-acyl-sn-glycerol-3-phosphate acyltransferase
MRPLSAATKETPASERGLLAGRRRRVAAPRFGGGLRLAACYGILVLFGITSLLWSLVASLLHRVLPPRIGEPLGRRVIRAGLRGVIGAAERAGVLQADLDVLDALCGAGPLVIAPNHPTLLDAVLIMSRVPHIVCAAKAPIWDNPFLGGAARLAGFVRNDSPTRLVRQAIRHLRDGRHFLIFPEGTRSSGRALGPFKGGFALIAKRAGAPVQPVFIETSSRFLGKGWPLFKPPTLPLVYRARLGERLNVAGDVHAAVERLERRYRQELGFSDPRR